MKLNNSQYETIKKWMYKNARPLDLARWQFHFEKVTNENVVNALSAYQNEDGGFGHALEPDCWNPNSSPIQIQFAMEILREIVFDDLASPIIQNIVRYLDSGKNFCNNKWECEIESNNDYPHASWWQWKAPIFHSYNPTAFLAGFMLRHSKPGSDAYEKAEICVKQAAGTFINQTDDEGSHNLHCLLRMYQYCKESGVQNLFDMSAFEKALNKNIQRKLNNIDDYSVVSGMNLIFINAYPNDELTIKYADYILSKLQHDGAWNIAWDWNEYSNEWAISKNWWKGHVIINNLLFLKQHHYLSGITL